MTTLNDGPRAERFAMRPPEEDSTINILEVRLKRQDLVTAPQDSLLLHLPSSGRKILTGVSKQSIYNNVLTDLFDLIGSKNYNYNRNSEGLDSSTRNGWSSALRMKVRSATSAGSRSALRSVMS